jgi:cytochrome c551
MKKWKWLVMIGGVFTLTGCTESSSQPSTRPVPISVEQKLYNQHCANCHGGNLQGSFGPTLQKIGDKYSTKEILTIIQKGKGAMPAQDVITKEEQQKLAQWLSHKK